MQPWKDYRAWSLVFLPVLLWKCFPSWEDVLMITFFILSQVIYYTIRNVRGMLFLTTLVLILWTRNTFRRWYHSQVLTREFFKNLLYLGLTAGGSLVAVLLLWMPLYEAYACVAEKLDKRSAALAMEWRDSVFLLLGAGLATSAVAQTDLVLRPSRVDESGLPLVLGALLSLAGRLVGPAMGWMREVVRVTCHCVKVTFTDAGILPKLIVAGYRRARGRKRLCAAGVAGNEGRDEDEGGEDFTVSRNDKRITRSSRPGSPDLNQASTSESFSGDSVNNRSSHTARGRQKQSCTREKSVVDTTSAMLRQSVGPTTTARRGRGGGGQINVLLDGASFRRSSARNSSSVTSTLLQQSAEPAPESLRGRPGSASDRSTVNTVSELLQQSVRPASAAASRPGSSTTEASVLDTTSTLLQKSARPLSVSPRNRSRARAKDGSVPHTAPRGPARPNSVARRKPRAGAEGESITDTTSGMLQKCVKPATAALGKARASATDKSIVHTTSDLLQRCVRPSSPGTLTASSTSEHVADTTSELLRRCARPTSTGPRSRLRTRGKSESVTDAAPEIVQLRPTPEPQRSGEDSRKKGVVETAAEWLQKLIKPPSTSHRTADGSSERTTVSSASSQNDHPALGHQKVVTIQDSLTQLRQRRATLPSSPTRRGRRRRIVVDKSPPRANSPKARDRNDKGTSSPTTPTQLSSRSLVHATSSLLQRCVTPTPGRTRDSGVSDVLRSREYPTSPTTRSHARVFRMENRGAGSRARSLREEMKVSSPSPGKPRRRCHECDY